MAINENKRLENLLAGAYYSRYLQGRLMYRNNKKQPIKITTKHRANGIPNNCQTTRETD